MTLSTLTYYGGDIPDGSDATPGLWDRRFSTISQNLDQLNSDADGSSGISVSRLTITTTLAGVPAATMRYITTSADAINGFAVYRERSSGAVPQAGDALGYYILGGSNGEGSYRNTVQVVGIAEGTWGASSGPARLEIRNDGTRMLSITSSGVSSHATTRIAKGQVALADGTYLAPSLTFDSNASGGLYYDTNMARWVQAGTTAAIFPLVAGALTLGRIDYGVGLQGPVSCDTLTLNYAPSSASHAATKAYVDASTGTTAVFGGTISAASVTDGSFSGEYQFSRATSALTVAGDIKGQNQYVSNVVGPLLPTLVGSQRSFGFGFSASNNYPMVAMSGVTQLLLDSTYIHTFSDLSMMNSGARVIVGNGSVTTCTIAVGTDDNAGLYYDVGTDELRGVAKDVNVLRLNANTATTPTAYIGLGSVQYPTLTFESSSTVGYPKMYFVASTGTFGSVQYDAANGELEVRLGKGSSSVDSELAKFSHPSSISLTGLWLFDGASGSVTPVEVLGNDTAATGYRALALANV